MLISALYMISQALVIHSFDEIEENNARRNVGIIQESLLKDIDNLNSTAEYLSKNMDSSLFTEGQELDYLTKNLTNKNFINSRINLIILFDSSNNIIYSKAFDLEQKKEVPVNNEIKSYFANNSFNLNSAESASGVLPLTANPMIVSIWPLGNENNSVNGYLLIGRYFNSQEIETNTGIKTTEIQFIPYNTENMEFNEINPTFSAETPIMIQTNESSSIYGFTILRDELGKAVYSLNVEMPRTIYDQLNETIIYYIIFFLIIGLILGLLILVYLDRVILKRLSGLIDDVTPIGESTDLSQRVKVKGNDEFQRLGNSINEMLSKLEILNHEISESRKKYKTIFENTGSAIATLEEDGTISLTNKEFEKIVGYSKQEIEGKLTPLDLIAEEDKERLRNYHNLRIDPAHSHAAPRNYEFNIINKKGKLKNIFSTVTLIPGTKKTLLSLLDITDKKNAEKALKTSEEMYKTLIKTSPDAVIVIDLEGKIEFTSPGALELFGYANKKELIGHNFSKVVDPEDKERIAPIYREVSEKGILRYTEFKMLKKDGTKFSGELNLSIIKDISGNKNSIMGIIRDITHHKKIEHEIKKSLKEKEILIKEIHHRVKNNMQIITSLLNLQSSYFDDKDIVSVFQESQDRVKSMAMVHEKLYQSQDLASINYADYINSLTLSLFSSHGVDLRSINLNLDLETIYLGIDTAIPLGLLITEIVTNAIKHAFPDGQNGNINIKLERNNSVHTLTISDDGVGIPKDLELDNTDSLGIKLIMSLAEQLDAKLTIEGVNGTEYVIKFKELNYKKRI